MRKGRISRVQFLAAAGGGAAGAVGLYSALSLARSTSRHTAAPPPQGYPAGQYQIAEYGVNVRPAPDSGVDTFVPPRWNMVLTARLRHAPTRSHQRRLELALRSVEAAYPYSPSGVFLLVAYGLPYFHTFVPGHTLQAHMPRMKDSGQPVLLDAVRFAGDPQTARLEANDVALHLRSDSLETLHDVRRALFGESGKLAGEPAPAADISGLFDVTSVRTGFVGAGLPRAMAEHAGLPFAGSIPVDAPLFMGFASAQTLGQAKEAAVAFDRPPDPLLKPLTTAKPDDYFAGGTALHVSHLSEDLEAWYALPYEQRAGRMFHLGVVAPRGRVTVQTLWLNPNTSTEDAEQHRLLGHNETVQRGSRSKEGQALQLRVDFNTMDPMDGSGPAPGVHFLAFTPGSEIFHQSRRAMDATDISGKLDLPASHNGINSFIRATRRQNFLVPARRHRAFPLIELTPGRKV